MSLTSYFFFLVPRKNWTSSWTVLQGSSLLFAKGQSGSTSWVRTQRSPDGRGWSLLSLSIPSLLLHSFLCCCSPPLFTPPLSFFLKSYYRSGLLPELLLTLLSSWKRSVKPRPAVSYTNCQAVQAAAVCPLCCSSVRPSFTLIERAARLCVILFENFH